MASGYRAAQEMGGYVGELEAERDCYKAALEEIQRLGETDGPAAPLLVRAGDIAADALKAS